MHAVTRPQPAIPPASNDPDASAGGRLVTADGRTLPLRHVDLAVRARGGIAQVVLTQRFHNASAEALSVRYLLPLPAEAAVSGFAFTLGDTRVVGEVQPRKRAREVFEAAVAQGRTAGLVEEERSTLFSQRVGNIPPGAEIVCEITLDQGLAWLEEGAWAWRFPTVVGPRYQGAPGVVSDAARINVPVSTDALPARATLTLDIAEALTGPAVSPSHELAVETDDEGTRVTLADGTGGRLDRDVVVRWPVAIPKVGLSIDTARPAEPAHCGRTYGLLTVVPPSIAMTPRARDLTLLIDTSGSMGGRPLDQAKRVMAAMIDRLGPADRIEMISFGTRPKRFRTEPIAATTNGKRAALKWLRKLSASGGTEMHRALLEALKPLRADAQRQVVLVTDGYIGFEQQIIGTLLSDLPPDCRLHTVGVGSAPNRTLTEGAARAGRGTELIVGLGEDPDAAADRMVSRTASPLVTELEVTGAGIAEMAPMRLPDLYAGAPALLGVACSAAGPITVRGRTAEGSFEHTVEVPALALGEGAMGVASLFGRHLVDDLDMRISAGETIDTIDPLIEAAGVRFQIATRKTSWVAVSDAVTVGDDIDRREIEQPHEVPYGTSVEGFGLRAASGSRDPMQAALASLSAAHLPAALSLVASAPMHAGKARSLGGRGGFGGVGPTRDGFADVDEEMDGDDDLFEGAAMLTGSMDKAEAEESPQAPPPSTTFRMQPSLPVTSVKRGPLRAIIVLVLLAMLLGLGLWWFFGAPSPTPELPVEPQPAPEAQP